MISSMNYDDKPASYKLATSPIFFAGACCGILARTISPDDGEKQPTAPMEDDKGLLSHKDATAKVAYPALKAASLFIPAPGVTGVLSAIWVPTALVLDAQKDEDTQERFGAFKAGYLLGRDFY